MKIENTFEVPSSVDDVWSYILDVERVAPCMPGAELTEVVDDKTWKGKVNVKIGPVTLSYAGTVTLDEQDEAARRLHLTAKGTEMRGKGTAQAKVTATLEAVDGGGTKGLLDADVTITGQAAQLARGMLGDISQRLTGQFAECLAQAMSSLGGDGGGQGNQGAEAGAAKVAEPVQGIRLAIWAVFRAVVRGITSLGRAIARLFGRR